MLDQLGLRGRAGGEVEQQRVGGLRRRRRARTSRRRRRRRRSRASPSTAPPTRDPRVVAGHVGELGRVGRRRDDVARVAALDAVAQVGGAEQRRRRDDHRAELHRGQHRLPQRDLVAEHQQHAVAAARRPASRSQFGDLVGARGQLGERAAIARRRRPRRSSSAGPVVARRRSTSNQSSAQLNSVELRPAEVAARRRRSPRGARAGGRARPGTSVRPPCPGKDRGPRIESTDAAPACPRPGQLRQDRPPA